MKKKMFILGLLAVASAVHGQSLEFNLSTELASSRQAVVPTLSWNTSPAASECSASGNWTGPKASSGSETLPPTAESSSYVVICVWPGSPNATLRWTPPTTNTDGSAYTNPNGVRIMYGRSLESLDQSLYVTDVASSSYTFTGLAEGVWYFVVRAVNTLGLESVNSNSASKAVTAGASRTGSVELEVKIPRDVGLVSVE